jgi:START domain
MNFNVICLVFCLATTFCFGQTYDCDLRKDTDGIKVYVCKSDHEKFKTLRAEFTLENTSIEKYLEFLFAVEDYPTWQYNMAHAQILSKISNDEMTYRSEIDAPWPLEDRELFVNFKVTRDAGPDQITIAIRNFVSDLPVKSGLIRVPFFSASYLLTAINETSLKVVYNLNIDPGGSIPVWLVNMALAEGPYVSFRNLKKRIATVEP